jgi:uncharacterized damage-inducible protein DinB
MATIDLLLQELEEEARTTRRVMERVPGDRLGWKPHDKSWTLGQLALHVASLPGGVAQMSTLEVCPVPSFQQPSATSVSELLPTLDQSVATAKEVLAGMDDATLGGTWRLMNGDREVMAVSRGSLLRSIMLNHWYHHRAQLALYLRQLDVPVPAIYGPSADENPFALEFQPKVGVQSMRTGT